MSGARRMHREELNVNGVPSFTSIIMILHGTKPLDSDQQQRHMCQKYLIQYGRAHQDGVKTMVRCDTMRVTIRTSSQQEHNQGSVNALYSSAQKNQRHDNSVQGGRTGALGHRIVVVERYEFSSRRRFGVEICRKDLNQCQGMKEYVIIHRQNKWHAWTILPHGRCRRRRIMSQVAA